MTWDEENRLMGINDNGRIHLYSYDAGGERVIKSSGDSQNLVINGSSAANLVHSDDYTGYVILNGSNKRNYSANIQLDGLI
ncbi:hypothetical protein [Flavobacterium sp.]|uniref:hypothetical protein n=1 Tax=Flavobacterium sp. TaxID=239 RepID=UPI003C5A95F6